MPPDLTIDVDDHLIEQFVLKAWLKGRTLEEEVREVLTLAAAEPVSGAKDDSEAERSG